MAYNITKTDGTPIVVADGTVDYSQLSIGLVGKNTIGYGDEIAQNFVQMIENFANNSGPANPVAGQIWYDNTVDAEVVKIHTGIGWFELSNFIGSTYSEDILPDPAKCGTLNIGSALCKFDNIYANTFHGVATSAQYADLAERYEVDDVADSAPGTVVKIGGPKEITRTISTGDTDVFGVISTAPGLMLNSEAGDDQTHPYVALAGRVPVKVHGLCKKGDRLMSSSHDGEAEVAPEGTDYRAIIGRALEDKDTTECKLIEAVVGAK